MTERLYYQDSHLTEFTASVVDVRPLADGRTGVTLDRTAFYPTGGGQPSDTGTLGAARVVECLDQETDGVLHVVEGELTAGASVTGRVDWPRRLDHLQQHTGQHILSAAFVKLYEAETRAFRLGERSGEIDLALDGTNAALAEQLERAVDLANAIIWENRPMRILHVSAEEANRLPLRRDSEREGELRLIEIEDFDLSPCGGTHAHATGEVGLIALRSWERAKGLTRIEFVAGNRALADYRAANGTARDAAALLSVGRDEAAAAAARLLEENKNLWRRLRPLEELAARHEAETLADGAARRERDGVSLVTHIFPDRDTNDLKRLAQSLIARSRTVVLLASRGEDDAVRFVFARSADAPDDMNVLLKDACAHLGGRGGGSVSLAQGGGRADAIRLCAIFDEITAQILSA